MSVYKLKFTRLEFETVVSKHHRTLEELIDQHKKGLIKPNDPVFNIEDLINICKVVAKGFWDNSAQLENSGSKWSKELRAQRVRQIITNAFSAAK